MIINPIIPIWIMLILCIGLVLIKRKEKKGFYRKIIISILLFVINLRIMLPNGDSSEITNNYDVLFVIDDTISMLAEDYNGDKPRFEGVKESCNYILEELVGSRFSVISFDYSSRIITPYTTDTNMIIDSISSIQQFSELYARGSSLNTPKEKMEEMLKNSIEKGDRARIVFFISDGEITNNDKLDSYNKLSKYIDGGAVLGFGTKNGGNMKTREYGKNETTYLNDTSTYPYEKAVSKIDEKNLNKIANDLNIDYIHIKNKKDLKSKINELKNGVVSKGESNTNSAIDLYYIFTIPLFMMLLYEFINYRRRL